VLPDEIDDSMKPNSEQSEKIERWANADDLADNAKAPDYLINDILESNAHGMMAGASRSLKTFMALKMAHSICTGNDFFGNKVFKTGRVLYVCGEGRGALDRRIKALKIVDGNFNNNMKVLEVSLCIDSLADMKAIKADVEEFKPVFVIFDTFSSLTEGSDENSNSDVARVMRFVRESCNSIKDC
jgi:RecA-family ATPase